MSEVYVTWLSSGQVESAMAESLLGLLAYDAIVRPQEGLPRQLAGMRGKPAGVNVATPRNEAVLDFLALGDDGPAWALLIDADMQFPPNAVEHLLALADEEQAPIVGGLCFGHTDGQLWPTMYELADDPEQGGVCFKRLRYFPVSQPLVRVSATGAAFLLVHRKVFEAVRDRQFNRSYPWFQETELGGGPLGEDLTFMLRAGICGFPVHVATGLHIGHVKDTLLTAHRYFQQEGRVVEVPDTEPQPVESTARVHAENVAVTRIPGLLDDAALSAAMAVLLAENPVKPPANLFAAEGVMADAA